MIVFLVGRIVQVILSVAQIKLATMVLEPQEYGVWSLIISLASFYILIVISPLGLYFNRHVYDWFKEGFMGEVFRIYSLFLIVSSLVSFPFIYFLSHFSILNIANIDSSLLAWTLLFVIGAQAMFYTWIPTLNIVGQKYRYIWGSSLSVFLGMVISYIFASKIKPDAIRWVLGGSIGLVIVMLTLIPTNWWRYNSTRSVALKRTFNLKEVFSFSAPLVILTLIVWAENSGYRFFIKEKIGLRELGLFSAGYSVVGGLFNSLETVLASFSQPIFYRNISNGQTVKKEMTGIWDLSLYPFLLAVCYLVYVGEYVARLFLADSFLVDISWIKYVPYAEGLRVIFNCISFHLMGERKTLKLVIPQTIGLILMYGILIFKNDLNVETIIFSIGACYGISICMLIFSDLEFYRNPEFKKIIFNSAILVFFFALLCKLTTLILTGSHVFITVTVLGFVFMIPYLRKHKSLLA